MAAPPDLASNPARAAGGPRLSPAGSGIPRDWLLALGESRSARRLLRTLGLPIHLPRRLRRAAAPWQPAPLGGASVVVGSVPGAPASSLSAAIRGAVVSAGGVAVATGAELGHDFSARALLFDASQLGSAHELRTLYDFFHPLLGRLAPHGRIIVLGLAGGSAASPGVAAARGALEGFVRSLAKEIGRSGATAQLLTLQPGSELGLEPVLRFLLSEHSAFVTGQSLPLSAAVRQPAAPPFVQPLAGKVALVTGAARGIGAATARLLAAEGAHLVCLDREQDAAPLHELARSLGGTALLCDVSAPATPAAIAGALVRTHGGVDVVVHNAGVTRDKTLARMRPEHWDQALDINLAAVTRIDAALDEGVLRDDARLIYLSSVVGIAGTAGQTNYASAKAGLIAYVRSRANLLAARGISVNAVAPGFIETRLTAAMPLLVREVGRRLNCLGQGGLPEDVGNVITFLASPGGAAISGAVVRVCGGALIGA